MKRVIYSILFILLLSVIIVKAETGSDVVSLVQDEDTNEIVDIDIINKHETTTEDIKELIIHDKQLASSYLEYLKYQVYKVKMEMLSHDNARAYSPSSMYDIAFSLGHYFPEWTFPPSLWKEDRVTRRRKIAKFFSTSKFGDRLYALRIRNKALGWASNASKSFKNDYADEMINGVDALFDSLHQFTNLVFESVHSPKAKPIIPEIFKTNNIIDSFAKKNNATFNEMMKRINEEFDTLVNPSGELRVSFESIRYDIMKEMKEIRNDLYKKVHGTLVQSFSDILNCYYDVMGQNVDIKSTQRLRTCFNSILKKKSSIDKDILTYKKRLVSLWKQTINELSQSPWQADYWIDAFAEVQEAATQLGKSIYKSVKSNYRDSGFRFNNNRRIVIQSPIDVNYCYLDPFLLRKGFILASILILLKIRTR
ncbi:hypothetical protein RMATCC62417_11277 [Rhizopus microsporus]|nr:hypothetical protein RMATCC62417_11277 [Rhizopus microsporus]